VDLACVDASNGQAFVGHTMAFASTQGKCRRPGRTPRVAIFADRLGFFSEPDLLPFGAHRSFRASTGKFVPADFAIVRLAGEAGAGAPALVSERVETAV
jgi:hypothetical protein